MLGWIGGLVDWEVDGMDEKQSSSGRERHKVLVAL